MSRIVFYLKNTTHAREHMGLILEQDFSKIRDRELTFIGETEDEELLMFLMRHAMMQNGIPLQLEQKPKGTEDEKPAHPKVVEGPVEKPVQVEKPSAGKKSK